MLNTHTSCLYNQNGTDSFPANPGTSSRPTSLHAYVPSQNISTLRPWKKNARPPAGATRSLKCKYHPQVLATLSWTSFTYLLKSQYTVQLIFRAQFTDVIPLLCGCALIFDAYRDEIRGGTNFKIQHSCWTNSFPRDKYTTALREHQKHKALPHALCSERTRPASFKSRAKLPTKQKAATYLTHADSSCEWCSTQAAQYERKYREKTPTAKRKKWRTATHHRYLEAGWRSEHATARPCAVLGCLSSNFASAAARLNNRHGRAHLASLAPRKNARSLQETENHGSAEQG